MPSLDEETVLWTVHTIPFTFPVHQYKYTFLVSAVPILIHAQRIIVVMFLYSTEQNSVGTLLLRVKALSIMSHTPFSPACTEHVTGASYGLAAAAHLCSLNYNP